MRMGTFQVSQDVLSDLTGYAVEVLGVQLRHAVDRIGSGDFATDQATLDVYADASAAFAAGLSAQGGAPMIETTARVLREAVDAGLGAQDMAVLAARQA